MKSKLLPAVMVLGCLGVIGCAVKVAPPLESALGMDAFERMGTIDRRDVSLALFLDPTLKDLKVAQKIKAGDFTFELGRAFSAKLIKALAYNFKTIHLVSSPGYTGSEPVNAIMRVSLQDVDVNMAVKTGFATVGTQAYSRFSIRADMLDVRENRTVWVGTTQAKEEGTHEEMGQMTYQEAGRGFATTLSSAIDKAIGDLVAQMSKSASLRTSLMKWEQENHGGKYAQQ